MWQTTRGRRGGFGDSEEERQFRAKATQALVRYHDRFRDDDAEPVWFERSFQFKLGPHVLRGRVDRVDRLPDGGYELIDYKTGRPKKAADLREDVQLALYSVAAKEAWQLEAAQQARRSNPSEALTSANEAVRLAGEAQYIAQRDVESFSPGGVGVTQFTD